MTILSRCQRFDLKRVSIEKLIKHLRNISKKENGKISDDALKLIAKSSEGSVRDSISLLDRALISQSINENKEISDDDIRKMLGLADKTKVITLMQLIFNGSENQAMESLKQLINDGIDAKILLNDILEVLYLFSRRISLGSIEKDQAVSEAEAKMIEEFSKNIDMQDIGLFWQLTIKTIEDLKTLSNENLALEMYLMQLVHLKSLVENEGVSSELNFTTKKQDNLTETKNNQKIKDVKNKNQITNQLKNTNQIKTNPVKKIDNINDSSKIEITSFQNLIDLANKEKEIELKYDLERNVKLVSFNKGKIDISFNDKLNQNFIKHLTEKLLKWTGERWIISLSKNSEAKSIFEKKLESKNNLISEFEKSKIAMDFKEAFPDAELIEIKEED